MTRSHVTLPLLGRDYHAEEKVDPMSRCELRLEASIMNGGYWGCSK